MGANTWQQFSSHGGSAVKQMKWSSEISSDLKGTSPWWELQGVSGEARGAGIDLKEKAAAFSYLTLLQSFSNQEKSFDNVVLPPCSLGFNHF
jgi:hypothetical protein